MDRKPNQPSDDELAVLMRELRGYAHDWGGFALRRAYEIWTKVDLQDDDGDGPRLGAKRHGRILALLEHREHFPRANHRLSGRIKVGKRQAEYLLNALLRTWYRNSDGETFSPIDTNPERTKLAIKELLEILYPSGTEEIYVSRAKSRESPFNEWCNSALKHASAAILISKYDTIVAHHPEIALKGFAAQSLNTALRALDGRGGEKGLWIWLVDYGLSRHPEDDDWNAYFNFMRLQGALAAYVHSTQLSGDRQLLEDISRRAYVVVWRTPTAAQRRFDLDRTLRKETFDQYCEPYLAQYSTLQPLHIFADPYRIFKSLSEASMGNTVPKLLIAVLPSAVGDSPLIHFPEISEVNRDSSMPSDTELNATHAAHTTRTMVNSEQPVLGVENTEFRINNIVLKSNDEQFNEALKLIVTAARNRYDKKSLPVSTNYNEDDFNPEEYVLLSKGFEILNIRDFLIPRWLDSLLPHRPEPFERS